MAEKSSPTLVPGLPSHSLHLCHFFLLVLAYCLLHIFLVFKLYFTIPTNIIPPFIKVIDNRHCELLKRNPPLFFDCLSLSSIRGQAVTIRGDKNQDKAVWQLQQVCKRWEKKIKSSCKKQVFVRINFNPIFSSLWQL